MRAPDLKQGGVSSGHPGQRCSVRQAPGDAADPPRMPPATSGCLGGCLRSLPPSPPGPLEHHIRVPRSVPQCLSRCSRLPCPWCRHRPVRCAAGLLVLPQPAEAPDQPQGRGRRASRSVHGATHHGEQGRKSRVAGARRLAGPRGRVPEGSGPERRRSLVVGGGGGGVGVGVGGLLGRGKPC